MIETIILGSVAYYLFNMIFVMIFEIVILDECLDIELDDYSNNNMEKRMYIPFYSLFSYAYLIIKAIYNMPKKHKKNKEKKAKDKIDKKNQKYAELLKTLNNLNRNIFEHPFAEYPSKSVYDYLSKLSKLSSIIVNNDSFTETAFNRIEYLIAFIKQCKENNLLSDEDIINQIKEMCSATDKLLSELVKDIEDTENKVKKEVKEHLMSLTKDFMDNTNSMIDDFKKFNK